MDITTKTQKELFKIFEQMKIQASTDPIYFIDTFCYTFNPKTEPFHFRFKLYPFQRRLVKDLVHSINYGEDIFIEKCREMGATYTTTAVLLWFWLFQPAANFLIGSRKEDYVDNRRGGVTGNKEESLFGKIDYMLNRLPAMILPKGFNPDKHFTYMSLVNPENGNVIGGESSNPNFSRGGRQKAVLLDEFAFWDNDSQAWGATADTTNCRIVLTTPGIRPSKAKRLRFGKDGEKIKLITLQYDSDPRKTRKWLNNQRERRSTEDFDREIMINWETSITGRVYPEIESAALGDFPYITNKPLYCSWDFGLDGTAIVFWQQNPANSKFRIIDCFYSEDKPIEWYLPLFGRLIDSKFTYTDDDLKAIQEISQLPKAIHFGDPDVNKRSLLTGTSTRQTLGKAKIYVQCQSKNDFASRREKTKVYLQKGIEINRNFRTDYLTECLKNARYPVRQETSQATTPINKPIHDWTCLAAGTLVKTISGWRKIEDLVGNEFLVYSYDEKLDKTVLAAATKCWKTRDADDLIHLIIGNKEIYCTPNHRFMGRTGFIAAKDLSPGITIRGEQSDLVVHEVGKIHKTYPVYDIEVPEYQNFVANGVIVHNSHYRTSVEYFFVNIDVTMQSAYNQTPSWGESTKRWLTSIKSVKR